MHAEKYGLDPTAFGAVGISAGGWLVSTASHSDGWLFHEPGVSLVEAKDLRFTKDLHRASHSKLFSRPTLAPEAGWPGIYGNRQAVAMDFAHFDDTANSFTPPTLRMRSLPKEEGERTVNPRPKFSWRQRVLT